MQIEHLCFWFNIYILRQIHTDIVSHVAFIGDVGSVLSSSHDGTVCVSAVDRPLVRRRYHGHKKPVYSFVYVEAGNLIASIGAECDVLLWNPYTCITTKRLQGHMAGLVAVTFNQQDCHLITVDQGK
jgi:WD40 repeat protein